MSYDIVLVPRREGQSWEEALRVESADTCIGRAARDRLHAFLRECLG